MRERIYTIPLTDVLLPGLGCPFCLLRRRAEEAMLHVYLDGMMVDVAWRGRVLREGFCARHLQGLQRTTRKLGGAILAQALLEEALTILEQAGGRASLPDWGSTCAACADLDRSLQHHIAAFIHTWTVEPDFRTLAAGADQFCLPHLSLVWQACARLPARSRLEIRTALAGQAKETLARLAEEVGWFVRKHDARFRDEPWNGAEDAVERAVRVLAGEG